MIVWNEFNEETDFQKIIDLIGMENERESSKFLVIAKFTNFKDTYVPRFAQINLFKQITKINVEGMSGNLKISHWTEINSPK